MYKHYRTSDEAIIYYIRIHIIEYLFYFYGFYKTLERCCVVSRVYVCVCRYSVSAYLRFVGVFQFQGSGNITYLTYTYLNLND
jgi:hypothetical protein